MGFRLGSFQTFAERLGRIEAFKKAWEIANISPLDIPGARGAIRKALPKPLEGPAEFAISQFNPLNAAILAGTVVAPQLTLPGLAGRALGPIGVLGRGSQALPISTRLGAELGVGAKALAGAYIGGQAGGLAERELGIPGAGLVGSLAGGFGGAAYGMRGLRPPLAPGMAEFPLYHAGDVEAIAKSGGLLSARQRGGEPTRGLGPSEAMTISTGTVAKNARIIEREQARMQSLARGSDKDVTNVLNQLRDESPDVFNGVFWSPDSTRTPQNRVAAFKRYLFNREQAGGDLDPTFIGSPDEIVRGLFKGVPGVVQPTAVADTEKILTAQLVNKVQLWTAGFGQSVEGANVRLKEWRNDPKTLKFLRRIFKTQDIDEAVNTWAGFTYQADTAAGPIKDIHYDITRKIKFGVDDIVAALLNRRPKDATKILQSTVKQLDPVLVNASKAGLEYKIIRVPGEPPIPISKVISVSGELSPEAVTKMVDDVGYDNVPESVQRQYDELIMGGGETAFTNQSELDRLRALREQALAKAKSLGFDPRSPRRPNETPEMTALRDQFHGANKQVGDLQRKLAAKPAAELPDEFKLAGDETAFDADRLIAEGDALIAEGRQAEAAAKFREAMTGGAGGVSGGGPPPPIIEGPGTFGEGFELGPGGGPPPGGKQPGFTGMEPPPKPVDWGDEIAAAANIPRVSLVSSADFSASFRQLFPAWAGKPDMLPKIIARQIESIANAESSAAFSRSLKADPDIQYLTKHGLHISTPGEFAEEAFITGAPGGRVNKMIEKIPFIRLTERAYTDATNLARSTLVKEYYSKWPIEWKTDLAKVRRFTSFVNELTGRGDIKALSQYAPFMNSVLFSPRLLMSRLKLPLRIVDLRHPEMREIVARHLAGTFGSMAVMAGMLGLVGVTVELDPRSANFMKARIGNMRVDLTGGFGPVYRYLAQIATGQRKTEAGEIIPASREDTALRFLRSKFSPVAGLVSDVISGETFQGRELALTGGTIKEQAWNNLAPLVAQDMRDAMAEEGLLAGVGAGVGSFFGVGVQTYPKTPQADLKARFREKYGKEYEPGIDNLLVENDPELSTLAEESQRYKLERGQESAIEKEQRIREFAQIEQDLNLPMLAEGVLSGSTDAGAQFAEQFDRYRQNIADVMYHEFFETDLPRGDTSLARTFDAWRQIKPEQYRDPATFEIDWEAYFDTKDRAFNSLPVEYRNAIEARTRSQDPIVKQVEAEFLKARDLRRRYYDLPKWLPQLASDADQDEITEIQRAAQVVNQQLATQGYTQADASTIYGLVLKTGEFDQRLVGLAMALRPGTKESKQYTNPDRQQFLLTNARLLQLFYPELYRSEQLLAQLGAEGYGYNNATAQVP